MKYGRCQGCGKRELLVSFRGTRCLSCVLMSGEYRGEERDFDQDVEADAKLDRAPRATGTRRGPLLTTRGHMTEIRVKLARRMRDDGMTFRAIARELGVSASCVGNAIRRGAA